MLIPLALSQLAETLARCQAARLDVGSPRIPRPYLCGVRPEWKPPHDELHCCFRRVPIVGAPQPRAGCRPSGSLAMRHPGQQRRSTAVPSAETRPPFGLLALRPRIDRFRSRPRGAPLHGEHVLCHRVRKTDPGCGGAGVPRSPHHQPLASLFLVCRAGAGRRAFT